MVRANIEIIYENADILVVNKPTGVSVTKDRTGAESILPILQRQLARLAPELRLVHRLDKDASGVMMLAKNIAAQRQLTRQFEQRSLKKLYLALVAGTPSQPQGRIEAPIAPSRKQPQKMVIDCSGGKYALTQWRLLADFGNLSLLAVSPMTGRTHQIRVHLQSVGMPIAIDPLYGSQTPLFLSHLKADYRLGRNQVENPLIDRLTLHAYQLELSPPDLAEPLRFVAGLDKRFSATLKMLTKYGPKGQQAFADQNMLPDILAARRLSTEW